METEVQPLFESNGYPIHLWGGGNIAGKRCLVIDSNLTACTTVQEDSRTQTPPNNPAETEGTSNPP